MSAHEYIFGVYDANTGAPKTGYAASLTFATYKDETGASLSQPTISEVGSGLYKFTPVFTPNHVIGFVLGTAGANPNYIFGYLRAEDYGQSGPSPQTVLFPVYDPITGVPKTAVTCTFAAYEDSTGVAVTPPAITEVGGGLYKFNPVFATDVNLAYVIDTAGNAPLRHSGFVRNDDFLLSGFLALSATAASFQVTVAFSTGYILSPLSGNAANPANWLISGPTTVTVTGVSVVGNQVVLTTTAQQLGGSYILTIPTGVTAAGGLVALLGPSTLPFTGVAGDPTLVTARSLDEHLVDIFFAFPPDPARALDVTQYSISPSLNVSAVTAINPSVYRLTTTAQVIGQTYNVTWPMH